MRKKKILCVAGIMGTGGVEEMIIELCNNLDKTKYDVSFFAYCIKQNVEKRFNDDVKVYSLKYNVLEIGGWKFVKRIYSVIKTIVKIFKEVEPDIIHVNTTASRYFMIALLAMFYSRKAVFVKTVHSSGYFLTSHKLSDRIRLFIEKISVLIRPTYLVGISKQVYEINVRVFSGKARGYNLIYNGIDIDKFLNSKPDDELKKKFALNDILVVYVARVVDGKNHMFLIELWKHLKTIGKDNIKLLLVGDGNLIELLREKVYEQDLVDNVIFIGSSDKVPNILRTCHFAVFPSEFEGFGISLIEKMATGLPVIVSDIPPFREIIDDNINGYIVDLKNREKWINLIKCLSEEKSLCNEIACSAIMKSKHYSVGRMVDEYEELYDKI